jgi:DNA-binding PadR family transcriptional regulator
MKEPADEANAFVPLADLPFHILLSLGDGDSHGYAIGKQIEERTSGRLSPTTGSLYQALRRLRESGLISTVDPPKEESGGDSRRRYFALTPLGRRVMALEVERLESLIAMARERSLAPGET